MFGRLKVNKLLKPALILAIATGPVLSGKHLRVHCDVVDKRTLKK